MQEIWLDSITLKGTHMVSNMGRIKGIPRYVNQTFGQRKVKEKISSYEPKVSYGYKRISLTVDGHTKGFLVHRMIAEVFVENPKNLPHVNHIDGNKLNNHPSNLEWCTHKQNMHHAKITGLLSCAVSICCSVNGKGHWYPSMEDAKNHSKVSKPCICAAAKKKQKTAGGMIWDYAKANDGIVLESKGQFAKLTREQNK